MERLARITAAAVATVLMHSAASRATSLARMSVVELAHASDAIVRAKCISSAVRREEGEIWTFSEFQVEESWKGAADSRITVRLLGGRLGEITSHVSGVPRFQAGEDVVLFLQHAPRGTYSVVSWVQGTFRIHRDARTGADTVTQDTATMPVFNPTTRQFEFDGIHNAPLISFREQVRNPSLRDARGRP